MRIVQEGPERTGQRAAASRLARPHVDPVEAAFGRLGGQRGRQAPAEARIVGVGVQRPGAIGFHAFVVVEEHEVEFGVHRHLAAAEIAESQHRGPAAGHAPVRARKRLLHGRRERADARIRDIGKRRRSLYGRKPPAQHMGPDLEPPVVGPAPHGLQQVQKIARAARRLFQFRLHFRAAELPRIEEPHQAPAGRLCDFRLQAFLVRQVEIREIAAERAFQQERAARQPSGEQRRGTGYVRHDLQQFGPGRQQGQQPPVRRQPGKQAVEARQGRVGVGRRCKRRQNLRQQPRQ